MALAQRRNSAAQRAGAIIAASGGAAVGNMLLSREARAVARAAVDEVMSRARTARRTGPPRGKPRKKKEPQGEDSVRNAGSSSLATFNPHRPIIKSEKKALRTSGSFLVNLPQNADGGNTWLMRLSLVTDGSATFMGYYAPKLVTFAGMYRHWRLRALRVEWVPNCADSVGGSFAMGFDADPACDPTTDFNKIYCQEISTVANIRQTAAVTWKPYSAKDREERYCQRTANASGGQVRQFDEVCFGTLTSRFWSTLATGGQMGVVKVDYVIDFDEECSS